ncbi:MAG: hypothetical protein HYZ36_01590, partial [Pedosphaera parvula]|nr:hypothetical protein [Pedosphaera parvula]
MKSISFLLAAAGILAASFPARTAERATPAVPIPPAQEILARVKKEHPRLLLSKDGFAALKQQVAANATLKNWHADLRREADKILSASPS